jgi:hypothetical protein
MGDRKGVGTTWSIICDSFVISWGHGSLISFGPRFPRSFRCRIAIVHCHCSTYKSTLIAPRTPYFRRSQGEVLHEEGNPLDNHPTHLFSVTVPDILDTRARHKDSRGNYTCRKVTVEEDIPLDKAVPEHSLVDKVDLCLYRHTAGTEVDCRPSQ